MTRAEAEVWCAAVVGERCAEFGDYANSVFATSMGTLLALPSVICSLDLEGRYIHRDAMPSTMLSGSGSVTAATSAWSHRLHPRRSALSRRGAASASSSNANASAKTSSSSIAFIGGRGRFSPKLSCDAHVEGEGVLARHRSTRRRRRPSALITAAVAAGGGAAVAGDDDGDTSPNLAGENRDGEDDLSVDDDARDDDALGALLATVTDAGTPFALSALAALSPDVVYRQAWHFSRRYSAVSQTNRVSCFTQKFSCYQV